MELFYVMNMSWMCLQIGANLCEKNHSYSFKKLFYLETFVCEHPTNTKWMWWCWIAWQSSMPSYCQITKLWNKYVIPENITHCKDITSNILLKHSLGDSILIQITPITIQWTMVCIISGLVIQRLYHKCAMYCWVNNMFVYG